MYRNFSNRGNDRIKLSDTAKMELGLIMNFVADFYLIINLYILSVARNHPDFQNYNPHSQERL